MQFFLSQIKKPCPFFRLSGIHSTLYLTMYWADRILPQICTASVLANMKHALTQILYLTIYWVDRILPQICTCLSSTLSLTHSLTHSLRFVITFCLCLYVNVFYVFLYTFLPSVFLYDYLFV